MTILLFAIATGVLIWAVVTAWKGRRSLEAWVIVVGVIALAYLAAIVAVAINGRLWA